MKAFLILEDGHAFEGISIGSQNEVISEVVFTTSMTGYLETLTDPSFVGQSVVMTYPLIGNYGICSMDMESERAWPAGFIIREASRKASNFRSEGTIDEFLEKYDVTGITGIDTRSLTKILRENGTMNGMITTDENYILDEVILKLKQFSLKDAVKKVTCIEKRNATVRDYIPTSVEEAKMTYMASPEMKSAIKKARENDICDGIIAMYSMQGTHGVNELLKLSENQESNQKYNITNHVSSNHLLRHRKIALLDLGTKKSIEHCLLRRGCEVTVYPAFTKAEDIIKDNPDGIMLSNGPGDPTQCLDIINEIKILSNSGIPIFAICLGHQLMALANGFTTTKLKYGHRGCNHPVKDTLSKRVYISSQNHGYVVDADSIDENIAEIRFINVNDKTVEGLSYINKKIYTVQFHPEASGGPQDTEFLFDVFMDMIG